MTVITGLILASGQGSRMASVCKELGVPKPLLPLPYSQTISGRIARSLANSGCQRIICTVREEQHLPLFREAFFGILPEVELVVKTGAKEYSEVAQAAALITEGNVIQTNGDLLFAKEAIENFVATYGGAPYFVRGREGNPKNKSSWLDIFNSRISVVPAQILPAFTPGNIVQVATILVKSVMRGFTVKVPTLFNIDTPQRYEDAKKFLLENPQES